MSSHHTQAEPLSRPPPRHQADMPFAVFMVILNVAIIAAIIDAAVFLPFLPESLKQSGWAVTIRTALIALLLFIPALIVVRETQRAGIRGTAVQLSERQYPELSEPWRPLPRRSDCGGGRTFSLPTITGRSTRSRSRRPVMTTSCSPTSCSRICTQQPQRPAVHHRPRAGPHPVPPRRALVPDRHRLLVADPAARPHALPATGVFLRPAGCRPDATRGDRSRAVGVRPVHRERCRYRRTRPARTGAARLLARNHTGAALASVRRTPPGAPLRVAAIRGASSQTVSVRTSSAPRTRRPGNARLR